jgi:hypothetical protein
MPATTTLASLLSEIAEECDLGLVIAAGTGATTSITETDTGVSELRGPFTGAKIPIGSPVTVITGGTVGEDSYVSNFVSSTGVVTLSPAITTAATGFIIWKPEVKHGKNVEKAVSRGHQKCRGWMKVPLTYVYDGDLLRDDPTDGWSPTNAATAQYVDMDTPDAWYSRIIRVAPSGANGYLQNAGTPCTAGQVWNFETWAAAYYSSGAASIVIRDDTNGATITPTYSNGSTGSVNRTNPTWIGGQFTIPTGCKVWTVRLVGETSGQQYQFGPFIAAPVGAMSYPTQPHLENPHDMGNFFTTSAPSSTTGLDGRIFYPYNIPARIDNAADGEFSAKFSVQFEYAPSFPIYYNEVMYGKALTALTNIARFPARQIKLWARAEIYDFLMRGEMVAQKRMDNGTPLPSTWRQLRNAAYKSARWSQWEPEMIQVVGRR